ncbi:hypothetical protein Bhyg_07250 [Pseudolycoriella hygida]|uniref:C-type lectin domain-containing protein n=1 Tax=Pseudolycoriella hygida TaxID=35572 RepID=A0A9Q0N2A7_9DIPT|nr:hypothetical protein Bhyg_07250 [Pseudolycoriella hygida]
MYALCPPDFFGIGTECYHISQKKQNWLDAHFDCKDRKSRLAEPNRYEDRMIRRFLQREQMDWRQLQLGEEEMAMARWKGVRLSIFQPNAWNN